MMNRSFFSLLLLVTIVSGCSDGPAAGDPVDLTGLWYLKDSSVADWPGFPVNTCVMLNRPVGLTYYEAEAMWIGREQPGGSLYCVTDGVASDTIPKEGPFLQYWGSAGSAVGDSVNLNAGAFLTFVGAIRSEALMNGSRPSSSWDGRVGTWSMSRRPLAR